MATYKQPCMHCGTWLDTADRVCSNCGSRSPFGYACPACEHTVSRDFSTCPGCGRSLYIACPRCHGRTFTGDACDLCGQSLMILCGNPRCGQPQFFENTTCTACGQKLKAKLDIHPKEA